jgi:hypothetical protein
MAAAFWEGDSVMLKKLRNAAIAASLGVATLLSSVTTAEARDRNWHRHRGGDDAALAIGAGIAGLAVGAAIASDRRDRYYDRYDRRYYRGDRDYYYDGYPRYRYESYRYRDYPRYRGDWRDRRDWRWRGDRRDWRYRDRYYRRGW